MSTTTLDATTVVGGQELDAEDLEYVRYENRNQLIAIEALLTRDTLPPESHVVSAGMLAADVLRRTYNHRVGFPENSEAEHLLTLLVLLGLIVEGNEITTNTHGHQVSTIYEAVHSLFGIDAVIEAASYIGRRLRELSRTNG